MISSLRFRRTDFVARISSHGFCLSDFVARIWCCAVLRFCTSTISHCHLTSRRCHRTVFYDFASHCLLRFGIAPSSTISHCAIFYDFTSMLHLSIGLYRVSQLVCIGSIVSLVHAAPPLGLASTLARLGLRPAPPLGLDHLGLEA
jgi:hypothetical protein